MISVLRSAPTVIQLDESIGAATPGQQWAPKRVELLRIGSYKINATQTVLVTKEHLASMVKNFNEKVRGIDLAIDYAHESLLEAAAWITGLDVTDDGVLMADVRWTPEGEKKVGNKEYRYLSADFDLNYEDNETLRKFGPTLLGAGLTNRPVVKRMAPAVELNEGKVTLMDPKDKMIADLQAEISVLKQKLEGHSGEMEKKMKESEVKCAELETKLKASEDKIALAEKSGKFDKMLTDGKAVEAQREAFMLGDMMKFAELSQPVKLSQLGTGNTPVSPGGSADVDDEIHQLAEKAIADKRVTDYGDAVLLVIKENPKLAEKRNV